MHRCAYKISKFSRGDTPNPLTEGRPLPYHPNTVLGITDFSPETQMKRRPKFNRLSYQMTSWPCDQLTGNHTSDVVTSWRVDRLKIAVCDELTVVVTGGIEITDCKASLFGHWMVRIYWADANPKTILNGIATGRFQWQYIVNCPTFSSF